MPDSKIIADRKITAKANMLRANGFEPGQKIADTFEAGWGGWFQDFQNCRIYSHHSVGTFEVHGGILKKFLSRNGVGVFNPNQRRELGFPKSDEAKTPEAFPVSHFEWGEIVYYPSSDGGLSISGAIYKAWRLQQFEAMGYPLISNTRKGQHEYVIFERGIAIQQINDTVVNWFTFRYPLLGQAAIIDLYKQIIPISLSSSKIAYNGVGALPTITSILADHLILEQVSDKTKIIPVHPGSVEEKQRRVGGALIIISMGCTILQTRINTKGPTLYNIAIRNENGGTSTMSPHSIFHRTTWKDFGILHATDIHVARRHDVLRDILRQQLAKYPSHKTLFQNGIDYLNNWNDGFRDFVKYANFLYKKGVVDAIIATGDIVDYLFEEGEWKTAGGNFKFFKDLVMGDSPYPDRNKNQEELLVPIFTCLGNHDYRVNPYELYSRLDLRPAIPDQDVSNFSGYNLTKTEARLINRANPSKIDDDDDEGRLKISEGSAKEQVIPATNIEYWKNDYLKYYKTFINNMNDYVVSLDEHKIIMLDSGPDRGAPDGSWDKWDAMSTLLGYGNTDEIAFQVINSPNSEGPRDSAFELFKQLPNSEGLVIVGIHAPAINIFNNEYNHYFRQTENRSSYDTDIKHFLVRSARSQQQLIKKFREHVPLYLKAEDILFELTSESVKTNFSAWFTGNQYFKTGSHLEFLHGGVSRNKIDYFLKLLCGLEGSPKPIDVLFTGHDHSMSELRLRWDPLKSQMQYYFDFYTENPTGYYNSKKASDSPGSPYRVKIEIQEGANPSNIVSVPEGTRTIKVINIPPYANPLDLATDKKAWWDAHKPLLIQGAPLGPTDQNNRDLKDDTPMQPSFEGCKLIIVRNNLIDKVIQVNRGTLAKPTQSLPTGVTGITFGNTGFSGNAGSNTAGVDNNVNANKNSSIDLNLNTEWIIATSEFEKKIAKKSGKLTGIKTRKKGD